MGSINEENKRTIRPKPRFNTKEIAIVKAKAKTLNMGVETYLRYVGLIKR
jgi:hypothetical protein